MNQLGNLIGLKFEDLDTYEWHQVITFYCDCNRYNAPEYFYSLNKAKLLKASEDNFYPLRVLKSFF